MFGRTHTQGFALGWYEPRRWRLDPIKLLYIIAIKWLYITPIKLLCAH